MTTSTENIHARLLFIRKQAERAVENFDTIKARFVMSASENPVYAMTAHGEEMMQVQAIYDRAKYVLDGIRLQASGQRTAQEILDYLDTRANDEEEDVLLRYNRPGYRHNSTSYIDNLNNQAEFGATQWYVSVIRKSRKEA